MIHPNIFHLVYCIVTATCLLVVPQLHAQDKVIYDAQAESLFNRALGAYESGNYAEASVQFEAIAKRKPLHQKSTAAYLMGARAHIKANNPQAAVDLLTPFFIRFPSSKYQGDVILLYADAQTAAGKYLDAFTSYSIGLSVVADRDQKDDLLIHLQAMLERARPTRGQFDALLQKVDDEIARAEIASLWPKLDFGTSQPPRPRKPAGQAPPSEKPEDRKPSTQKPALRANTPPRFVMVFPSAPPTDVHASIINDISNGIESALKDNEHENGCRVYTEVYRVTTLDSLRMFIRGLEDDPAVMGIIGGAFSDDARMLVKATAGTTIPVLLPTATASDLAAGDEVFQLNVTFEIRGQVLARYVRDVLKARTVAILAPLRSYARTIAEAFKVEAQRIGLIVDVVSWYRPGTDDMTRQFNTLRTQQFGDSIDVLFAPVERAADIAPILEGVAYSGVTNLVLGAGDWAYPDSIAAYIKPHIQVEFATEYCVDSTSKAFTAFKSAYQARYGATPSRHAVFGYDAAGMLLRSLCESPADREAVVKELHKPYSGLHSHISLSQERQNTALTIMRYRNRGLHKHKTIQEQAE